jgi:phosphate transport system permease protein
MTDVVAPASQRPPIQEAVRRTVRRRYAAERRLKAYGIVAICFALAALLVLLVTVVRNGYSAFTATVIALDVKLDPARIDPDGTRDPATLRQGDYFSLVRDAIEARFPAVESRGDRRQLAALISSNADLTVRDFVLEHPELIGTTQRIWVPASSDIDMLKKGKIAADVEDGRISEKQAGWYRELVAAGDLERRFNTAFFTNADSREPESAGIWGALVGSFYTMLVTLALAFPLGVATAIYLEEFAPKNRWTDLIEVNINNLAAVPSIVFGLLGLAVFLGFFGLPRSAPLVGGMVLALITLPTLIIASRAALKSVPPSIREAAFGIGASRVQVVTHHVLPLSMPGILTGTIIGMAHALGETAPLLMIGMVAFIVDAPASLTDPATLLPVQIFLWADSPERGFVEKTSAAIIVLLAFLILMNSVAIILRKRFEQRW